MVHYNALAYYAKNTGKRCANNCGRKSTVWYHQHGDNGKVGLVIVSANTVSTSATDVG